MIFGMPRNTMPPDYFPMGGGGGEAYGPTHGTGGQWAGQSRNVKDVAGSQLKKGWWKKHGGKVGLAGVGLGLAAMYGIGSAIQASVAQVRTQNRNWDRQ